MMGWYHDGTWSWGGWIVMTLGMALVWGAVVAAIVVLFRSEARNGGGTAGYAPVRRGPEQILAERFARSEIDDTEYRFRAGVLGESTPSPVRGRNPSATASALTRHP